MNLQIENKQVFFTDTGEKFDKKNTNDDLVWFHGSSVGEILSIVPLIEKLEKRKI